MNRLFKSRLGRFFVRIGVGLSADALLVLVCYRLELNLATTSLLFLMGVVLQSLGGGIGSSAIAAVIAAGLLDFYFVPPVLNWRIADPFDGVALLAFLTTSLVITSLASKARSESKQAERRRKSLEHLYQASQRLLWVAPEAEVIPAILKAFCEVFGLHAVCFFDGAAAASHVEGESGMLVEETHRAYLAGANRDDTGRGVSIRCFRHAGRVTGAIGFDGLRDPELTAGPLVALAVGALERALASQAVSRATAEAQGEVFRAAVLDALAHEFKTPLAVITTAAGGLREIAPLSAEQEELAGAIEEEADRLGNLTTKLLRKTNVNCEDIRPRLKESDLGTLVARVVDRYTNRFTGRHISLQVDGEMAPALVDEELYWLALSQLMDNAIKYSPTGGAIAVTMRCLETTLAVRVWNEGTGVPLAERLRIFERFYSGSHGQSAGAGTGLGLYVARKIARAHGGSLEIESGDADDGGTAFCLTLPCVQKEVHDARELDQPIGCG